MDAKIDGVIAGQVSVDEKCNTVVVWVTLDRKDSLDSYLATEGGKSDHGELEGMSSIIDTFVMYDSVLFSGRLW